MRAEAALPSQPPRKRAKAEPRGLRCPTAKSEPPERLSVLSLYTEIAPLLARDVARVAAPPSASACPALHFYTRMAKQADSEAIIAAAAYERGTLADDFASVSATKLIRRDASHSQDAALLQQRCPHSVAKYQCAVCMKIYNIAKLARKKKSASAKRRALLATQEAAKET